MKGTDNDALEAGTSAFSPNRTGSVFRCLYPSSTLWQIYCHSFLWACVCVCMCVCMLGSSRDKLRARDRRYKTERVCE